MVCCVLGSLTGACDCNELSRASGPPTLAKTRVEPAASTLRPEDPSVAAFVPVLPDDERFRENPRLLARLVGTPHGYFRFINIPFSQAVCTRYSSHVASMPTVNLHGDAHLEQYTVTDFGVGLSDFDDSSFGPGIIDLLRFATSLSLAARERGWDEAFEPALEAFLDGYRTALRSPECARPTTRFAERARAGFVADRGHFLERATGYMTPLTYPELFAEIYARYRALMESEHPDLPPGFFELKQAGRFHVGVGSALDEKYLVRVEGLTPDPLDDVILEAKEVRDLGGIECVYGNSGGGAFRILTAQSRIGEMPHRFLAQVPRDPRAPPGAPMFWVHEWVANYLELRVGRSVESPEELASVARDVGIQLGKGHTRAIASPLDSQLRRAQLALVNELETSLREATDELSQRTLAAWEWFRAHDGPDD